jgi:hypothetical protein
MNKPVNDLGKTFPMPAESVNFSNGMIVTADDLTTAMDYSVALMKSVNRAVFGCGVVCGFELKPNPGLCERIEPCDPCDKESKRAYPSFTIEIGRGTALDCSGLPVELCKPELFDLGDRKCGCDEKEGEVCIFIRRVSSPEAPRGDCCGSTGGPVQCSRVQDHVEIRAFPMGEAPEHACMHPFGGPEDHGCGNSEPEGPDTSSTTDNLQHDQRWPERGEICKCLTTCRESDCCGEGWILIGCLELCKGGVVVDSFKNPYANRKWIKSIECFCRKVQVESPNTDGYEEQDTVTLQLTNKTKDPDIKNRIKSIVQNEERAATFMLAGVINMEHFSLVLEKEQPRLQKVFGFSTPTKLEEWREATEVEIQKDRER